ncbi:MAG: hypothetical protein ACRDKI_04230 [Solirubrobacterales bacterium]
MTEEFATIAARYKGPPDSGNGGYACGVLGTLIGDCAEVTLKAPPPLETSLKIERDGDDWKLLDGDALIAEGRPVALDLDIPAPPTYEEALAAEPNYGFDRHIFPGCFVCGPDRAEHDGLRIFTGRVGERDIVASHWHPQQDVAGEFGAVRGRVVWGALDCPTYFGGQLAEFSRTAVLGRLTAKLLAPVQVGEQHIVIGWPIGVEGRKLFGGSAIFTASGELRAFARGTWIAIPEDHGGFDVAA